MPLLAPAPYAFPIDLFAGFGIPRQVENPHLEACWWVVYARSRHEKKLAAEMHDQQTPFFLPLTSHQRVIRGKRCEAQIPVFAGYLFAFTSRYELCQKHLASGRISTILDVPDQNRLYDELSLLKLAVDAKVKLTSESRLIAGDSVRVKNGPFKDRTGTVVRRDNHDYLQVAVSLLGRSVLVKIEDFRVEKDG